jgi:hypothetical protein
LLDNLADHQGTSGGRRPRVLDRGAGRQRERRFERVAPAVDSEAEDLPLVRIDEGDDPPVYHDEEGLISVSYSNFVFDLVAAQRLRGQHLSASGPVPDDGKLASLALRRGPVTRTDALVIHRFYRPHEYATARWAPGDEIAVWNLEADSDRALDALRETIDRVAGVPRRGLMSKLARRKR